MGIISILQSEITTGGRSTGCPPVLYLSAGAFAVIMRAINENLRKGRDSFMKKFSRAAIVIAAFIAISAISVFAGSHIKEKDYLNSRTQRCTELISFAIDKIEHDDLSNQDVMEAVISNVYAAYQFCDNPNVSNLLHDLWNELIFEGESSVDSKDVLVAQLKDLVEMIRAGS